MRVHRLEIEAFGPFADPVVLDVDALSAEGLFLIHGPTGSGKTSLLDAICFALYADVPGARSKRGLRSDHAAPDAVPRVTLELTAGTRRFRITRSPEFLRPKRRGTGFSKVQASVALEELLGSDWRVRGTRHDEVADLVKDVLGMGMAQFAKVVMLPQGDFAAFLRATPEDRREVLERLFDISTFTDVEAWLAEERRCAGVELERLRAALATELSRVEDVLATSAVPAPTSGAGPQGDTPADSVPALLRGVVHDLDARVTATMADFDRACAVEVAAAESLSTGRTLLDRRDRGARAHARLRSLAAQAPEHAARGAAVARAERAAAVQGHLVAADRAEAEESAASQEVLRTGAQLAGTAVAGIDDDAVVATSILVHALDDVVAALGREATGVESRGRRRDRLHARAAALAARSVELDDLLAAAEADQERLGTQVEQLAATLARVPELELRVGTARERLEVLALLELDEAAAVALGPRRQDLREAVLDRRTALLDLRQRRLDGMAGELAGALVDGEPCPVCGGADHPAPASPGDAVPPADVESAEVALTVAEEAHAGVDAELRALRTRVETRRSALGGSGRDDLSAAVQEAVHALDEARSAAARHSSFRARRAEGMRTLETHRAERARVGATLESVASALAEVDAEDAATADRVRALHDEHADCPCSSADPAEHARVATLLSAHRSAVEVLAAATTRRRTAAADLAAALQDAGFEDDRAARAAALDEAGLARLRSLVTEHVEEVAAARGIAEDPDVLAALDGDAPDLPALELAARGAREAVLRANAAQDGAERALRGLERLLPGVEAVCTAVAGAARRDARVRDLADTASGIGPDNTLRMRLTAYVLAARLEKVAALANERLLVMGGGRYVLEHSDERAARGARSGLGLRVLDQWTGRARDTATLSGGESFMASLALALGLADAVREEVGGLDLGTLFIDEGFGSLDDDSLEQVLTVLDGLREGGRAVGVVSHVADLRARITHQAVVHKGAAGSRVEVRVGGPAAGTAA